MPSTDELFNQVPPLTATTADDPATTTRSAGGGRGPSRKSAHGRRAGTRQAQDWAGGEPAPAVRQCTTGTGSASTRSVPPGLTS